ncbi:MAG: maleylacetoacetate isomerase [Burkholderiales bacterium]|nr:maleylacetoacetate isomerase [Burkholderiales bacterium]
MKLYGYWRSQATFRVRVAMNLKGIPPRENEALDLAKGEQFNEAYRRINPLALVPSLVIDNGPPLTQSMAIMEYLEETHPNPPLLPRDPRDRARVRALALISVAEIHPLMVPRVRNYVEKDLGLGEDGRVRWIRHWVALGLRAVEDLLDNDPRTGRFCHGDSVTMADICLAGQVIGARNSDCDVAPYTTVVRIADECMKLDAFAAAHPRRQPDAPKG